VTHASPTCASREGPRDIVFPNRFTNCDVSPELPSLQGWVEAKTSFGRLILFDQPGTGAPFERLGWFTGGRGAVCAPIPSTAAVAASSAVGRLHGGSHCLENIGLLDANGECERRKVLRHSAITLRRIPKVRAWASPLCHSDGCPLRLFSAAGRYGRGA
jgi:hypothetical protein